MKNISAANFIKLIKFIIILTPISFLFHYIETSISVNGSMLAFSGGFLFILLAGVIAKQIENKLIIIISILSSLLSIGLGKIFIIAPNESWFNPFGMEVAIALTSIIILMGILTVKFFQVNYLNK